MKEGTTKKTVFSGLFWRFAERFGAQGVSLVVSVVLARLLDPGVYGTVALVTVFTNILETFADSGFGNALIRKRMPTIWIFPLSSGSTPVSAACSTC